MVLKTITNGKNINRAWVIIEEADTIYNDPEFSDFTETQFPMIFTTVPALNVWLAELADNLADECEFTYNEYTSVRLAEMEPGDKYPLYIYVNTKCIWSNHRQGFVVAI